MSRFFHGESTEAQTTVHGLVDPHAFEQAAKKHINFVYGRAVYRATVGRVTLDMAAAQFLAKMERRSARFGVGLALGTGKLGKL